MAGSEDEAHTYCFLDKTRVCDTTCKAASVTPVGTSCVFVLVATQAGVRFPMIVNPFDAPPHETAEPPEVK